MSLRTASCLTGLLGGGVWVARTVVGEDPALVYWVGLALLGVAFATAGASLVKKGTWWLRLIVAVAFPALVWSIYAAIRPATDALAMDAVSGGLAVLFFVVLWWASPAPPRTHGSHAR